VAIVRGIAVMFDAGPEDCGAVEIAMEEARGVLEKWRITIRDN
jgi:hypothetical protein